MRKRLKDKGYLKQERERTKKYKAPTASLGKEKQAEEREQGGGGGLTATHFTRNETPISEQAKNVSMVESNTVVSAYTMYRHLQQYCSQPSVCPLTVQLDFS